MRLLRSYLLEQAVIYFVISFFLLKLFVKAGGESMFNTYYLQNVLAELAKLDLSTLSGLANLGLYFLLAAIFLLFGMVLIPISFIDRVANRVLPYVGLVGVAGFAFAISEIMSYMNDVLGLISKSGPLPHIIIWWGIISVYAIMISQLAASIFVLIRTQLSQRVIRSLRVWFGGVAVTAMNVLRPRCLRVNAWAVNLGASVQRVLRMINNPRNYLPIYWATKGKFYVGADGCTKGWFAVRLDDRGHWSVGMFETIGELWQRHKHAKLILIDVPIGLRDFGTQERVCDTEARRLLGRKRSSSVFPVPCRTATRFKRYETANQWNKALIDKGLSSQAWGIIRKIREVDEFLLSNRTAASCIREIHPEVCFWAINNRKPMIYSKKSPEGFEERKKMLRRIYHNTTDLVNYALDQYRRNEVARDDVLDSLVAAVTASKEGRGLSTIPEKPEYDWRGLPMEMVYFSLKG